MTCRDIENQLSAYLDDELATAQRAAVANHLDACPACRAYLARLVALGRVLRAGALAEAPDRLLARVLGTIATERRRTRVREWGLRLTAAAAGLALCVIAQRALILSQSPGTAAAQATVAVEASLHELRGVVAGGLRDEQLEALLRRPEVMLVQELARGVQP